MQTCEVLSSMVLGRCLSAVCICRMAAGTGARSLHLALVILGMLRGDHFGNGWIPAGKEGLETKGLNLRKLRKLDRSPLWTYFVHMKTATLRDLRNDFAKLEAWLGEGEEIEIQKRGKAIAMLMPVSA